MRTFEAPRWMTKKKGDPDVSVRSLWVLCPTFKKRWRWYYSTSTASHGGARAEEAPRKIHSTRAVLPLPHFKNRNYSNLPDSPRRHERRNGTVHPTTPRTGRLISSPNGGPTFHHGPRHRRDIPSWGTAPVVFQFHQRG